MNKKIILVILLLIPAWHTASISAQNRNTTVIRKETLIVDDSIQAAQMTALVDSILATRKPTIDTTLVNADIFSLLKTYGPYTNPVKIHQQDILKEALYNHILKNRDRQVNGYRIRIFFDNSQSSRDDSKKTEMLFIIKYPEIPTYRTYSNPYFKVTVGDFRTKSEAMRFLEKIKNDFPAAFMVKENIFR